ncbi:MAG: alkaline phosphatase family protein, partial [Armatimonadota bacterium]
MSKVELCFDLDSLVQLDPRDVLVSQVSDYVTAYIAMAHALHIRQPLRVIIRHRACNEWLREAFAKYGTERITASQISYRTLLEQRWGILVPKWVEDRDLIASKLLELPALQATPSQSFEDLVLEYFWGISFTYPILPLGRLAELANDLDTEQWHASERVPVAHSVLTRRLAKWEENASQPGERKLITIIREDPGKLKGLLSRLRVLKLYPQEVGLRCMGENFSQLIPLRLDLSALALDSSALHEAATQVQVYLQDIGRSGIDQSVLGSILDKMSGDLVSEFDWVERLLKSGTISASRTLLDRIRVIFKPIRHRLAHRLVDLDLLIEPPRPSEPCTDWAVDRWVVWAVQEYLPYRFWLEANGVLDEEVARYADMYADWLFEHFPGFVSSFEHLVYRAIYNLKDTLNQDEILLFVMLDNMGFCYAEELRSLMLARGYQSLKTETYVSMLPSATAVSKKAMAVGDPSPFAGTAYKEIVEATWKEQFQRKTRYLGRIGDLQELSTRECEVYILNYTPLDDALHSDPRSTGISFIQAARQALENLAESIHSFALRFGIEDTIHVVVCPDHGSTLIPASTPNVIDAEFIAKRVDDVHHRYVSLTDEELNALPKGILDQCYCFRSRIFGLDSSYLAARGYGRFRKDDSASYVHGGLTPEETL